VKIQQVTDEIANSLGLDKTRGALVLELSANSPAVGSGLQPGDVITAFDGHKIDEMHQLPRLVADTKIGKKSTLTVWRKGREISINVIIGELPTDKENPDIAAGDGPEAKPGPEPKKDTLGMALLPLTPQVRQQYDVADSIKGGVVVAALDRSAEAAKRGVQPGDVILDVNQQPVEKAGDVKKGVEAAKKSGHDFALMRVARGEQTMFVTISVK
jgi:serine protease Do